MSLLSAECTFFRSHLFSEPVPKAPLPPVIRPLLRPLLNMPVSVAGSSCGKDSTPGSARKVSSSRMERSVVNKFSDGLGNLDDLRRKVDLEYISEQLAGESGDLVDIISTMMRGGTLRAALERHKNKDGLFGKRLPPSMQTFRGVSATFWRSAFAKFENQFTSEYFDTNHIPDVEIKEMAMFALNVKASSKLPGEYAILRHEGPLVEYLHARYKEQGSRLKAFEMNKPMSWGNFTIEDDHVLFRYGPPEAKVQVKALTRKDATDWLLMNNHKLEASLDSKAEQVSINVKALFQDQGIDLGEEPPDTLELPDNLVPRIVAATRKIEIPQDTTDTAQEGSAVSSASGAAAAPGPKRARKGAVKAALPAA